MIKKNEGFMLVEAIVASVIVVSAMISLYSVFNNLYTIYNSKNSYYNIDAMYATKNMVSYLQNDNFNSVINEIFESNQSKVLVGSDSGFCYSPNETQVLCNMLRDTYNINTMIIAEYDKTVLEENIKQNKEIGYELNQTFKDYIDFVIGYYDISEDNTRYSYIVLTEIKNGNSYYYANLGIE